MIAAEPFIDRWLDEGALAHWFAKVRVYPELFAEIAGIIVTLAIAGILKWWRGPEEAAEV
jgi:hypothetical protein